tara:strand:- start:868 stop:1299 length:432 start_codon:yes stop_codon:yes gene_type:complete
MEQIRERIKKRAELIAKMERLQKVDLNALGEYEPRLITKEIILKGVLRCSRRDFDSVFWRHKANGKVNRIRNNVKIRQMYFYFCKRLTNDSLKEIGKVKNGGKLFQLYDHTTVIHAVRSHENLIESYKSEKKLSDSVMQYLRM